MEPAPQSLTQIRIIATVARCFTKGSNWYVQFDGSWESLCIGPVQGEEPAPFTAGEEVDIIIRKRNALPR